MHYEDRLPEKVPPPGFYYHYKHDASKGVRDYAYFIYGVGHHTEDDCSPEDAHMLVYQPLYEEAFVYKNGRLFDLRPLPMFYERVIWNGKEVDRFTKIEDDSILKKLKSVHRQMYPHFYLLLD